jgi:hypothetical protein
LRLSRSYNRDKLPEHREHLPRNKAGIGKGLMFNLGRQFLTLFTAFAVFVVATTCTASGCLLPKLLSSQSTHMSCCENHSNHAPAKDKAPGSCAVRNDSLFAKSTEAKAVENLEFNHLTIPVLAFVSAFHWGLAAMEEPLRLAADSPPLVDRPTLLSLSCSFLT